MLNPVRKAGSFVKRNRVPITTFVIGAVGVGIVGFYVMRSHEPKGMAPHMSMMWNDFLKENALYDAWDKHLYTYR